MRAKMSLEEPSLNIETSSVTQQPEQELVAKQEQQQEQPQTISSLLGHLPSAFSPQRASVPVPERQEIASPDNPHQAPDSSTNGSQKELQLFRIQAPPEEVGAIHQPFFAHASVPPSSQTSQQQQCDSSTPSGQDDGSVKHQQQHFSRPVSPRAFRQVYPAALASHEAVLADQNVFLETLHRLHAALGIKFTIPKIGEKDLDLHKLYKEVTCRGGLEVVIKDGKWNEVTSAFQFHPTATSASYFLWESYIGLLRHYEQVYFLGVQGQVIPSPAPQTQAASQLGDIVMNLVDSDQLESEVKRTKGIIDSAEALGVDPASSIGSVVTGAIDGKFDHGYLVTVMVGTRKMSGVLYHVPSTNTMPQNACVPALMNSVGSELKASDLGPKVRRKRRKDIIRKDPNAPRQNRTGYNFFFAEQRAKLKTLQPDKDRAISKMIGDSWNKLSEDEKTPYLEQGLKDKERYKREMREYKEKIKLPIFSEGNHEPLATMQLLGGHTFGNGGNDHAEVAKLSGVKELEHSSLTIMQPDTSIAPVPSYTTHPVHGEGLSLPV